MKGYKAFVVENVDEIIIYIRNRGTKDNPVPNKEISANFRITEAAVRKKINAARCEGIPICSCDSGYYYSEDKDEILKTVDSLMHRTIAIEKAVKGLVSSLREGGMADGYTAS